MKSSAGDFAIVGGRPAFVEPLHVGRPNVGDPAALHDRIGRMLERRWFTNDGPFVRELEARVAETVGTRHCVAVASATKGLEILARAAKLEGEVIVPSFTFVGTAHSMLWNGLRPRFCDVDPQTHTLDPAHARELIGPDTSAILGVHVWGRPCRIGELEALAAEAGVQLLFDAAHAFACSHGDRMLGSFGRAEVFSFHATKVVHSFEGGAITTDDGELAAEARLIRNFGFADYDQVVTLGTNGKMSEASAAMGLTSLDALDSILAANRRNHDRYRTGLAGVAGITVVGNEAEERWNHQYVVLEVDREAAGLSRDELYRLLWAEGVLARRYFYPGVHALEPYRSLEPDAGAALPATERLVERVLCLPTGNAIGEAEIDTVCEIVASALRIAPELRSRLESRQAAVAGG